MKQNLIVSDLPTVAGFLLFADEPQIALPKRSALFRYQTKEEEESRETLVFNPLTIEGCAYDQIQSCSFENQRDN